MKRKKIIVAIVSFLTWIIGAFFIFTFFSRSERPIFILILGAVVIVFQELVSRHLKRKGKSS
ncbi:hypothetical protein [Neobacillus sp.]|uniref:hypothetical protein n=1 Tax=Neobacillus sp. TaxID=2675273 RepID=UPI00289A4AE8|nr:hypothetical protein [Neobacillus sp.]